MSTKLFRTVLKKNANEENSYLLFNVAVLKLNCCKFVGKPDNQEDDNYKISYSIRSEE